jgi:hypothetical protein
MTYRQGTQVGHIDRTQGQETQAEHTSRTHGLGVGIHRHDKESRHTGWTHRQDIQVGDITGHTDRIHTYEGRGRTHRQDIQAGQTGRKHRLDTQVGSTG